MLRRLTLGELLAGDRVCNERPGLQR